MVICPHQLSFRKAGRSPKFCWPSGKETFSRVLPHATKEKQFMRITLSSLLLNLFLVLLVAVLTLTTGGCGRLDPKHSEAISVIEKAWNEQMRWNVLPMGEVQIVRSDKSYFPATQTTVDDMPFYYALKERNLIVISSDIDLTSNRGFSWGDFYDLSQKGIVRKLTVKAASPQDEKLKCPDSILKWLKTDKLVCIDTGVGSVEEIVRSQKFQIGTKQYWLVMGNHKWRWSDLAKDIRTSQGQEADEERKFMAIFRLEDFAKEWLIEMVDYAPRIGEFKRQSAFDMFMQGARITGGVTE